MNNIWYIVNSLLVGRKKSISFIIYRVSLSRFLSNGYINNRCWFSKLFSYLVISKFNFTPGGDVRKCFDSRLRSC